MYWIWGAGRLQRSVQWGVYMALGFNSELRRQGLDLKHMRIELKLQKQMRWPTTGLSVGPWMRPTFKGRTEGGKWATGQRGSGIKKGREKPAKSNMVIEGRALRSGGMLLSEEKGEASLGFDTPPTTKQGKEQTKTHCLAKNWRVTISWGNEGLIWKFLQEASL